MKLQTVYIHVSMDERLPKKSGTYRVIGHTGSEFDCFYEEPTDVWQLGKVRVFTKDTGITHWLEEQPNMIVLTKEELKKFATDFYYYWHNQKGNNTQDGYDDFLNSKLKP